MPADDGRLLHSVVQNSWDVVKIVDPDGTLRYANPAFKRMFGYDPGEAVGKMNVLDHVHPDDLPRILEKTEKAMAEEGVARNVAEYRFRHADGTWKWVESVGTYLLDASHVRGVLVTVRDISGRKEAEEALRRSEAEIFSILESITDCFFALDREWRFTYVNPQAEALFSKKREDLVGEIIWEDPTFYPHYQQAVAEDKTVRFEGYYPPLEKWYSVRAYPSGSGLSVYLQDVTERKRAEEKLKETEERYRTLVEHIPAVTYIDRIDEVSSAIYMSPQVEEILGYTAEEWLEDPELWIRVLHPEDKKRILAEAWRTNETGDPFRVEYRMVPKSGPIVWVRDEAVLVRDEQDIPLFWQGILYDITERRRVEAALKESEQRFRKSFDDAPIGMTLVAPDGRFLQTNRSLCEILGYPEEELLSKTFRDIIYPEDLDTDLDYLRKMLAGEIRSYQTEKRYIHREGHMVWVLLSVSLVHDEEGEPLYFVSQIQDVSERKRMEERLQHQALHDNLTGLPNRHLFVDRLGQALERTRRRGNRVAVLFMDLNGFKVVNDSLGHEAGDLLLTVVAQRLGRCLRPEDTLARFGGDEFVVLVEDVDGPGAAVRVAERITEELRRPFVLEGRELYASASIGIAMGTARTKSPEDLLRDADTAMYRAKDGGGGFRVFDPAMYERAFRRLELENDLRRAIEAREFVILYQPIFDFGNQGVWGVEALVRWNHPERGLLNPGEFVPVAEETGLIVPIGNWVLEEACRQTKGWQESHPRTAPLGVIVNLSAKQLRQPDCVESVRAALAKSGLGARSLSLDVTETAFIDALEGNRLALERIQALGVRISIDDFGMGYSSLSYLKRLPADALKIDKSFVKGFGEDTGDTAIVRMVIDVGHTLGLRVVAEGVETWAQAALLEETGCDMAQGYHFAGPLPPEEIPALLSSDTLA